MNSNSLKLPLNNLYKPPSNLSDKGPSIFLLHGFGSNMQDLFGLAHIFPKDWTIVSLQASIPVQHQGWAWAELDFENLPRLPKPEQMEQHQESVKESINKTVQILNLDPDRINLLGFSQGASLSIFSGLMNPLFYNSIVALCGFIPVKEVLKKVNNKNLSSVDLFMGNGIQDPVVPLALADKTFEDLTNLNIRPIYKKYNSEHTISNDCIYDILNFLRTKNI